MRLLTKCREACPQEHGTTGIEDKIRTIDVGIITENKVRHGRCMESTQIHVSIYWTENAYRILQRGRNR